MNADLTAVILLCAGNAAWMGVEVIRRFFTVRESTRTATYLFLAGCLLAVSILSGWWLVVQIAFGVGVVLLAAFWRADRRKEAQR